jgi:hypothetical protein
MGTVGGESCDRPLRRVQGAANLAGKLILEIKNNCELMNFFKIRMYIYIYIHIYTYVCVCVCEFIYIYIFKNS